MGDSTTSSTATTTTSAGTSAATAASAKQAKQSKQAEAGGDSASRRKRQRRSVKNNIDASSVRIIACQYVKKVKHEWMEQLSGGTWRKMLPQDVIDVCPGCKDGPIRWSDIRNKRKAGPTCVALTCNRQAVGRCDYKGAMNRSLRAKEGESGDATNAKSKSKKAASAGRAAAAPPKSKNKAKSGTAARGKAIGSNKNKKRKAQPPSKKAASSNESGEDYGDLSSFSTMRPSLADFAIGRGDHQLHRSVGGGGGTALFHRTITEPAVGPPKITTGGSGLHILGLTAGNIAQQEEQQRRQNRHRHSRLLQQQDDFLQQQLPPQRRASDNDVASQIRLGQMPDRIGQNGLQQHVSSAWQMKPSPQLVRTLSGRLVDRRLTPHLASAPPFGCARCGNKDVQSHHDFCYACGRKITRPERGNFSHQVHQAHQDLHQLQAHHNHQGSHHAFSRMRPLSPDHRSEKQLQQSALSRQSTLPTTQVSRRDLEAAQLKLSREAAAALSSLPHAARRARGMATSISRIGETTSLPASPMNSTESSSRSDSSTPDTRQQSKNDRPHQKIATRSMAIHVSSPAPAPAPTAAAGMGSKKSSARPTTPRKRPVLSISLPKPASASNGTSLPPRRRSNSSDFLSAYAATAGTRHGADGDDMPVTFNTDDGFRPVPLSKDEMSDPYYSTNSVVYGDFDPTFPPSEPVSPHPEHMHISPWDAQHDAFVQQLQNSRASAAAARDALKADGDGTSSPTPSAGSGASNSASTRGSFGQYLLGDFESLLDL